MNDLSLSLGHKRIQQPNIDDLLAITENFDYIPSVTKDEQAVLKKFDLKNKLFYKNYSFYGLYNCKFFCLLF